MERSALPGSQPAAAPPPPGPLAQSTDDFEPVAPVDTVDEDLMRRVQTGDRQAFSLLYERYSASALSYLYRMLGNAEDAEAIGQEVFLRIFRFAPTYRYPQRFTIWFFTIARSLAINHSRRKTRSAIRNLTELNLEGMDINGDPRVVAARATDDVAKQDEIVRMLKALDVLPTDHREVIVLGIFQELSYSQMAGITGTQAASLRSRIFDGLSRLANALGDIDTSDHEVQGSSLEISGIKAEEPDIDADLFLQLMSDALRAGPHSAQWHDVTARVTSGGAPGSEQYAKLLEVRVNLEIAKSYRSIRAGPGFWRKLQSRISGDAAANASRTRSPLSASFGSYVGVALVVGMLAVLLYHVSGSATEDLGGTLSNTTLSASLEGPLAPGWRVIGSLPVDTTNELRPGSNHSKTAYLGGGVVVSNALSPTDIFAIEATFHIQHLSDGLIPQFFVADTSDFNSAQAGGTHELAWLIRAGQGQVVLPNGELAGTATMVADGSTFVVQIRVGINQAAVLVDGNVVWTGASQLAEKPRYPGIRLLRRVGDQRDMVTVKNVKILSR